MSKAVKYVKNMQALGGTGLLEAIKASLKKFSKKTNVAKLLFLLTDGAPNNPWSWIHGEFERINYVCFGPKLLVRNKP